MITFNMTIINPEAPELRYIISNKDDNSFWIADGTGEGGEFSW